MLQNAHPTLLVYNQSCRAKQSESSGKTAGGRAPDPHSAQSEGRPVPRKLRLHPHIMRGLAQQAVPLCPTPTPLRPSHHHHHLYHTGTPSVALLLKSCSVPRSGYYTDNCQDSCFTWHWVAGRNMQVWCLHEFDNVLIFVKLKVSVTNTNWHDHGMK